MPFPGSDSEDELDDDIDLGALESAKKTGAKGPPKNPRKIQHTSSHLTPHEYDAQALQTYIYPTNLQVRDYQYNIVLRSFYHNTLVALPTGLGKTFIASTVILNFNRWFPSSKIIFMAPTKPLVAQQIKACCGITGIEASKVAILLDKLKRNRAEIWADKQVFFTTPQVVENDLAAGILDPKSIVLLVIDEAHRSKGNYAYNNVAKFISRFNTNYRILAMTATPSSTVEGVQEIIDNLQVSKMEVRTESSIDIFRYLKRKTVERVSVETSDEVAHVMDLFGEAVSPILKLANEKQIYDVRDFRHINHFTALDAQRRIMANKNIPEGLKWANHSLLSILSMVGQCIKRLNIYGVRSFYSYFSDKHLEFTTKFNSKKSKNATAAKLHFHPSIKKLMSFCEAQVQKPDFLGHRKLEIVISELSSFYETSVNPDSRVIIFTEFRESALDIVRAIEANQRGSIPLKPHIFIGQARERDKFDEEASSKKGKGKKLKDPSKSSSEQAQVTGMNQKLQKEIIKQFKSGVYNVLVATSIGEEGLDIGEVDFIICYDSTSSPIKNIQRMGRTGRNRDGKVLVLFSGNEETKFDKAMGGYDYIQQHIMNGKMVDLHDQVRVIPSGFEPKVVEKLIEIPDENAELKNEEDEDEIIKIATRYMSKSKSKQTTSKKIARQPAKIEKRFFMPDNVVTGFQSANTILNGTETREADLLDAILDSDVDDFEDLQNDPMFRSQDSKAGLEDEPRGEPKVDDKKERLETERHEASNPQHLATSGMKVCKKQPEIMNFLPKSCASLGTRKRIMASEIGTKRAKNAASEESRVKQEKSAKEDGKQNEKVKEEDNIKEMVRDMAAPPEPTTASSDEFSDDDEILALARRTQSFDGKSKKEEQTQENTMVRNEEAKTKAKEGNSVQDKSNQTVVDPLHVVSASDGLLTKEENMELYINYYTPLDPRDTNGCLLLSKKCQEKEIPHNTKTRRFLSFHEKKYGQRDTPTESEQAPKALDDIVVLDEC